MTIVLWTLVAILWTIVVLAFGIYVGRNWEDDKKIKVAPDANVMSMEVDTSQFDSEIQAIKAKVDGLMGHQHHQQPCDHADKVTDLEHRVNDLASTVQGYNDRFTRVEKRAGLSV